MFHPSGYHCRLQMPPAPNSNILLQGVLFPFAYPKAILQVNKHSVWCQRRHLSQCSLPLPAGCCLSFPWSSAQSWDIVCSNLLSENPSNSYSDSWRKEHFSAPVLQSFHFTSNRKTIVQNRPECSPRQAAVSQLIFTARVSQLSPGPDTERQQAGCSDGLWPVSAVSNAIFSTTALIKSPTCTTKKSRGGKCQQSLYLHPFMM